MPVEENQDYCVFVSAAEPSGDTHCAAMIAALKRQAPGIRVAGVGGPKMAAAGCALLANPVERAVMLVGAAKEYRYFYGILKDIKTFLRENRVDLMVVCDSPAFNFHVAKTAKKAGVPTLFYVAPQLWAWASWRIRRLRRWCDKLCCVLPFEEEWFRSRGVDTTFVSNPLLDPVAEDLETCVKTYRDYDPKAPCLALMPGSRRHEIESLWQPMQEIALRLKADLPQARFITVAASEDKRAEMQAREIPGFACEYHIDAVRAAAKQADLTLVASGSATLEVASAGCPMLVMYQANKWTIRLLGWMVSTEIFSLVNIVAGRVLVPEFMPRFESIDPLVAKARELTQAPERMAALSRSLVDLAKPLAATKTCEAVAQTALDMLDTSAGTA